MFRQLGGFHSAGSTTHSFIHRLQHRDEAAWAHYDNIYGAVIFTRYIQAGADADLAEELTQQVMVAVYDRIKTYEQDSFRGWLWVIAKRALISHVRSAAKPDRATGGDFLIQELEDLSANPGWERLEEAVIARAFFEAACDHWSYSVTEREVFQNNLSGMQPAQEAAIELGISVAAFYQRKSRLLAQLKRLRDPDEFPE